MAPRDEVGVVVPNILVLADDDVRSVMEERGDIVLPRDVVSLGDVAVVEIMIAVVESSVPGDSNSVRDSVDAVSENIAVLDGDVVATIEIVLCDVVVGADEVYAEVSSRDVMIIDGVVIANDVVGIVVVAVTGEGVDFAVGDNVTGDVSREKVLTPAVVVDAGDN